ncbi:hypothetical protein N7474_000909 [Penicillium riverlandense]|uniref:uncharacterized protein n=1 Tax=Penicillium riverlandense TaxID=1903569 RepID=UPI002549672C|nr:uncharacterized protein N7474_000909 [Penicillium riverlandense]KAJ5832598.1 hypothetical protein N7474_000909 [Penicillium riverlandense]
MAPQNRKQRRAAAAASVSADSEPSIPLAHPPRGTPSQNTRTKTLYDIIAERQNQLLDQDGQKQNPSPGMNIPQGMRVVTTNAAGEVVDTDADSLSSDDDDESEPEINNSNNKPLPPLLDTVLLTLPLTTLHFTLAFLAAHQYAEKTDFRALLQESLIVTFPLLTFLIHLVHGHIFTIPIPLSLRRRDTTSNDSVGLVRRLIFPPSLRTVVFLPVATVLGAHLIAITNGDPYYAVMKKAPAVGTLWIWCILEMSVGAAMLGALGPLVWGVWWMGYGIL